VKKLQLPIPPIPERLRKELPPADGPLGGGRFTSPLHDTRNAAYLGMALGVAFTVCFITGIYSHLEQHPPSWWPIPPRPAGLYRLTQGVHVATGIASIPLLLAKLWTVWPRFFSYPPVKGIAHAVERLSLLPLVGGSLFQVVTGVSNIAHWYWFKFYFTTAHYEMSWVVIGGLVTHIGAKWVTTRDVVTHRGEFAIVDPNTSPSTTTNELVSPALPATSYEVTEASDAVDDEPIIDAPVDNDDPGGGSVDSNGHRRLPAGMTRRGFLVTAGAASLVITAATVGETLGPLRRLDLLGPRRPNVGPQGLPVNRSAKAAKVTKLPSQIADYRLEVTGAVKHPLRLTLEDLQAMEQTTATLPIACVEGWSASATWTGIQMRELLAQAGATPNRTIAVESLEPNGAYKRSTLNHEQAHDPDCLLALRIHGDVLALDHGYPLRLIAPNRPGVLQTKWVGKVTVL
jgi:DMSO/TMAO reductase YedYZ molybdopterin-dependent catalytic subunit